MIRALVVGLFLAVYILLLGPPFILHALLTRRGDVLFRVGCNAARAAMWLAGIRVRIEGLANIPPGVCIFVGNHSSNVDPPAVVLSIPRRVSMLGKKEVFAIPLLGTALRLTSFVAVDRADREAAAGSIEEALRHLKGGISFLVFPEGTRSPDGRLRRFKKGTFLMAIRAGVPIVPVSVVGAQERMPRGSKAIHPGEVIVRFHPPISTASLTTENKSELLQKVFAVVASGLPDDQKPASSAGQGDDAENGG